ncbi:MAG: STN domain-containing protein [Candidatus Synoicihabitans palmerolidicus]|nr:STN domain-containing protein [Candidatus Synoicihabitans palmerolidicus]
MNMPSTFRPLLAGFVRIALFAVLALGFVFSASAEDESVKSFDLPAAAADSLQAFATQAGRELIFQPSVVRDVSTPAVKGSFTIKDALARLLADTDLKPVFDADSGAIAIVKKPLPAEITPRFLPMNRVNCISMLIRSTPRRSTA